jgi:hypothetical protein
MRLQSDVRQRTGFQINASLAHRAFEAALVIRFACSEEHRSELATCEAHATHTALKQHARTASGDKNYIRMQTRWQRLETQRCVHAKKQCKSLPNLPSRSPQAGKPSFHTPRISLTFVTLLMATINAIAQERRHTKRETRAGNRKNLRAELTANEW